VRLCVEFCTVCVLYEVAKKETLREEEVVVGRVVAYVSSLSFLVLSVYDFLPFLPVFFFSLHLQRRLVRLGVAVVLHVPQRCGGPQTVGW
jgi:hypothetical protein